MLRYASLVCIALAGSLGAQTTDRPWLGEVNLYPALAGPVSRLVADKTVDSIEATKRAPGFSVARRLSPRFSAAYSLLPGIDYSLKESWGFGNTKDGKIALEQETGAIHAIEGRWHPFRGGLHASAGVTHARPTRYDMDFIRTGPTAAVGTRQYASDFDVRWVAPSATRLAIGGGYSRTLRSGITLSASVLIPIPARDGGVSSFNMVSRSGAALDSADSSAARESVRREVFYAPVLFRFGVGYSFRLGRK